LKRIFILAVIFLLSSVSYASSFIVKYYIRDVSPGSLESYLSSNKLSGYLFRQNERDGVIFNEKVSADQDDRYGSSLGLRISRDLKCRIIYSIIHDSDVLLFRFQDRSGCNQICSG
jgi:hypothetical protein